jgi:hypothetical protein
VKRGRPWEILALYLPVIMTGRYKATTGYCFEAIGYDCGVPYSRDLELREEALRLGRELLRGTKYEQER